MALPKIKFSPTVALYGALFAAAAITAYLLHQDAAGLIKSVADPIKNWWASQDASALGNGQTAAASAAQPRLTYLQARAAWFVKQGLSGSPAINRASMPDFPTEAQWEAGKPFPVK